MDFLDNYRYFVLSHRKWWLSVFGSDRKYSVRLLKFSLRILIIEIYTENKKDKNWHMPMSNHFSKQNNGLYPLVGVTGNFL